MKKGDKVVFKTINALNLEANAERINIYTVADITIINGRRFAILKGSKYSIYEPDRLKVIEES